MNDKRNDAIKSDAQTVFVCMGSNAPNGGVMLALAKNAVLQLPGVELAAASPRYLTEPQDYRNQPWFYNRILKLRVDIAWEPCDFLNALLRLEAKLGRRRAPDLIPRFGPRAIDLDLLLFGEARSSRPHCVLPHPRLTARAFVLAPLRDISPGLRIDGRTPGEWLARLDWRLDGLKIFQAAGSPPGAETQAGEFGAAPAP